MNYNNNNTLIIAIVLGKQIYRSFILKHAIKMVFKMQSLKWYYIYIYIIYLQLGVAHIIFHKPVEWCVVILAEWYDQLS